MLRPSRLAVYPRSEAGGTIYIALITTDFPLVRSILMVEKQIQADTLFDSGATFMTGRSVRDERECSVIATKGAS
jgi:hypothetical protein